MNKEYFNSLALHPDETAIYDVMGMNELVKTYPFFQSAHILLLYNLKKFNTEKFNIQLRESSVFVPDRGVLFNLISNISDSEEDTKSEDEGKTGTESAFGAIEKELPSDKPVRTIDFQLEEGLPVEIMDKPEQPEIVHNPSSKSELLEFEESNPGLSIASKDERTNDAEENDLISKFLDNVSGFKPKPVELTDEPTDISTDSITEPEDLITETLAKIFETQKLYDKAISAYEKLILKFPEKSTYFASRIEELRKISK